MLGPEPADPYLTDMPIRRPIYWAGAMTMALACALAAGLLLLGPVFGVSGWPGARSPIGAAALRLPEASPPARQATSPSLPAPGLTGPAARVLPLPRGGPGAARLNFAGRGRATPPRVRKRAATRPRPAARPPVAGPQAVVATPVAVAVAPAPAPIAAAPAPTPAPGSAPPASKQQAKARKHDDPSPKKVAKQDARKGSAAQGGSGGAPPPPAPAPAPAPAPSPPPPGGGGPGNAGGGDPGPGKDKGANGKDHGNGNGNGPGGGPKDGKGAGHGAKP